MIAKGITAKMVVLMGVLALAACDAPSVPGPPAGAVTEPPIVIVTYDEMVAELRAQAETLELPPGVAWPPPPPAPEPAPDHEGVLRGTSYEEGVGRSIADTQWWCAWEREWLAQRGLDRDREATALATLHTVTDTYLYNHSMDSHSREWVDGMLQASDLGDPGLIANDVGVNCDQ
jgi:hypothetical protein